MVAVPASNDALRFADGVTEQNALFFDNGRLRLVNEPDRGAIDLEQGTYIYIGHRQPVETSALLAIIDNAAPAWLRAHLEDSMAEMFAYLKDRLGPLDVEKPSLLATFRTLDGGSVSFGGGVVATQLVIDMGLGVEVSDTPGARLFLARFFAHEAVHLWNNGRVTHRNGDQAWMHEGGANALAWLGLLDLELTDRQRVKSLFESAARDCAESLASGPLVDAGRRGDFQAYYDCGAMMALATHGAMAQRNLDLFDFWRLLMDTALRGDGSYDESDYITVLSDHGSTALAELIPAFVQSGHENALGEIATLLIAAGLAAVNNDDGFQITLPQ
jgi:hypothetical protein